MRLGEFRLPGDWQSLDGYLDITRPTPEKMRTSAKTGSTNRGEPSLSGRRVGELLYQGLEIFNVVGLNLFMLSG